MAEEQICLPDTNEWDFSLLNQDWVCDRKFYFDHSGAFCKAYTELRKDAVEPSYLIPHYVKNLGHPAALAEKLSRNDDVVLVLTAYMRLKSLEERVVKTLKYLADNRKSCQTTDVQLQEYEQMVWCTLSPLTAKLNLLFYQAVQSLETTNLKPWLKVCRYIHKLEREIPLYLNISAAPKRMQQWHQFLTRINI